MHNTTERLSFYTHRCLFIFQC